MNIIHHMMGHMKWAYVIKKVNTNQIDMYECFNNRSRLATKDDLKQAGLVDCVNNLGLLDEDETDR